MERFQPANGTSAVRGPQHRRTCWPTSLPRVGVSLLKTSSGARDPFGMSANGVRREKAALSSGCKPHPATAPAGSNRSSHGGNEVAGRTVEGMFVVLQVIV